MTELGQKRYLIAGATGGLGFTLVERLAGDGAWVEAMVRDEQKWFDLWGTKPAVVTGGKEPMQITAEISRAAAQKPFSGIVYCMGRESVMPLRLQSDDAFREAMRPVEIAMAVLRAAAKKDVMTDGGSIVLVSSVAAQRACANMSGYAASKAALEALGRAAALELAPRNIRVNSVAPGAFASPMHERITAGMSEDGKAAYSRKHPLGIGTATDVADVVVNLLHGPSWMTGTTVTVDGGLSIA